MQEISET